MLKRKFLLAIFVAISVMGLAQNEVGAFVFPQITNIYNTADDQAGDIYKNKLTLSGGIGANFIHFFHGKRDDRKRARHAVRAELIYSAHNQKWTSKYRVGNGEIATWNGKKRLDYIKVGGMYEISRPITKHISLITYAGPQFSVLISAKGGIVTWQRYESYDYFDLPPSDRSYYKGITIDAVGGMGFDYEYSKWINISMSVRGDFSLTTIENADNNLNGYTGSYTVGLDARGSRNITIAVLMGLEYTIHKPEHARTRF